MRFETVFQTPNRDPLPEDQITPPNHRLFPTPLSNKGLKKLAAEMEDEKLAGDLGARLDSHQPPQDTFGMELAAGNLMKN